MGRREKNGKARKERTERNGSAGRCIDQVRRDKTGWTTGKVKNRVKGMGGR